MKIYCSECKYLESVETGNVACGYKENTFEADSWLSVYRGYKIQPSVLNKDNSCGWFDKKADNKNE